MFNIGNVRLWGVHRCIMLLALAQQIAGAARISDDPPFPGPPISRTSVRASEREIAIGNNVIQALFIRRAQGLTLERLRSPVMHLDQALTAPDLFVVHRGAQQPSIRSSQMQCSKIDTQGRVRATFVDASSGLRAQWQVVVPEGANYLRQVVTLTAEHGPLYVDRVELFRASLPVARATGSYDGLPVITDQLFLGIEHPMSQNRMAEWGVWSPAEMQARGFTLPVAGLTGTVLDVRFDYQRGHHRIDVAKVELLDASGKTVSEDVHAGFSGIAVSRNNYRLVVPTGLTCGSLRVTLGGNAAETDSYGKVSITGARNATSIPEVICGLPRRCELKPGDEWKIALGIGVYPPGQLRRSFLRYVECERAHPYRQYWHYNSWYDLNIGSNDNPDPLKRMTEAQCLEVIRIFGSELYEKRGVGLDGYVWDDGWDDWNSLWGFHEGFPNGFAKLKEAAARQGSGMGAWLSPWGGYGASHDRRVSAGRAKGYETNPGGFSLGGPKYYAAYRDVCLSMIRDYNQNYFKFDGIGGGTMAGGAPASIAPDLDALVKLLGELRHANSNVFINCTVGTWPSPYWTWFADSVWRQGDDCSFAGEGNDRERWITYRDGMIYRRFVQGSPLYPLNSLMYHGLLVSKRGAPARMPTPADNPASYQHELMMSVACGSGLGELYVSPSLMTTNAWIELARGLRWSRDRAAILRDTHWIGGAPDRDVYGYAAWHPARGGTIVLRNPTSQPKNFALDLRAALELTPDAPKSWTLHESFKGGGVLPRPASADQPRDVMLEPFEVIVFDVVPTEVE